MTNLPLPKAFRGIAAVRAEARPTADDYKAAVFELADSVDQWKTSESAKVKALASRLDSLELAKGRMGMGGGEHVTRSDEIANAKMFYAAAQKVSADFEPSASDLAEYHAYEASFGKFLRCNPDSKVGQNIRAAMSVGSDPDGGYWVPPTLSNTIITKMFDTSPMREVCGTITIPTDSIQLPLDTNDAVLGGWVAEREARAETDTSQIGEQQIYVREQYAQPKLTQKLLDMSTFDVEGWLSRKIADKLGRTENTGFVSGAGVTAPRGLMNYKSAAVTTADATRAWGVVQYIPTGASGALPAISGIASATALDCLHDTVAALHPSFRANARWACNRATGAYLRKLVDGNGRPLIQESPLVGTPARLLGYTFDDRFEDFEDVASDSFSLAFGDFRQAYLILDGPGIRVLRDPYTEKPYVKFYTTKWTGGDLVNSQAIKFVKFAAS